MSSSCLILLVSILLGMATNVCPAEISFPDDHFTVDMESDPNAYFVCSLTLTSDESITSYGILWTKNDTTEIASSNDKYVISGYSVLTSSSIVQTLLILNVVEDDLGTYQCTFLLNSQVTNDKASARLYIQDYVPPPLCLIPTKTIVSTNDEILIQCTSDPGDPAIQMAWSADAGGGLASYTQTSNNQLSLDYLLTVPNADEVISYTCKTYNTLNDAKSCNTSLFVNPFNLLITQLPETALVGQDVMFTCLSDSNTASSISWSFPSMGINYSDDGSTLTIYDVQSSYDGLVLTCTVNAEGGQQTISTQTVLNVTSPVTTQVQQTTIHTTMTSIQPRVTTAVLRTTTIIDVQETEPPVITAPPVISIKPEITSNTNTQTVSPSNQKDDQSPLSITYIILIAVCGSIILLLIFCVVIFCCHKRPQTPSSNQDISTRMEYYKNVAMENEIKEDMVVTHHEISFVPNNFNEPYNINEPIYYNNGFEGQIENEIYYKDDGWSPPTTSPQTTTL